MSRLERLQAILIQLQSKRIVRAKEIAERFQISERTVYRDIKALEASGVPIGAEAGVGYFLVDTFSLPPVMFTNEEASALLIGNEMVASLVDGETKEYYSSAMLKIKAVLKVAGKDHLDTLDGKISVAKYSFDHIAPGSLNIQLVKQAISKKQCLKLTYKAQYNGQQSERVVEPIGVVYYSMEWHLIAYCRLRKEYRDFRLDRVVSISESTLVFDPDRRLSLNEYLAHDKANMLLTGVRLKFHPDDMSYVRSVSHWFGDFKEVEEDGELIVECEIMDMQAFVRWLLGFDKGVTVLSPALLQDQLEDHVRILAERYLK